MPRPKKTEYGKPDAENPEWTKADFARARPAKNVVPEIVAAHRAGNLKTKGRPRGSQKQAVSIRLDKDVLAALKEQGAGWQTRLNDALRSLLGV